MFLPLLTQNQRSMSSQVKITPAPGFVLVVQKRSTGGEVGGIEIAAKESAIQEGEVGAVGYVPRRFRAMRLRRGDLVTFARFNTVVVPGTDGVYLAVAMQHIVCKKESGVVAYSKWQRFKGAMGLSMLGASFAAGYFANDAWKWAKSIFKK